MRSLCLGVFALVLVLVPAEGAETPLDESNSWAFAPPPDRFRDDALLDLRFLNETQSGEKGFVRLSKDGNDLVLGDGRPARFWAVGSDAVTFTPEQMDAQSRWLAKLGVNLVRLHVTVCVPKEGSAIDAVNDELIAAVHRVIRACKDNGIYVLISPFYPHFDAPTSWGLEGDPKGALEGMIFYHPGLQAAYRAWTRAFYTRVNPHTGLAIKDDPTVAVLQVLNEDSLFFWTTQGLPKEQRVILGGQFSAWLAEKYGSVAAARAAWGEKTPGQGRDPLDDPEHDRVVVVQTWELTQDARDAGHATRLRDTVEFLARRQRRFYEEMGHYLRMELGCHQLLNASNWRTANDARLKGLERWSYHALDIDAENEYVGSDYQHKGPNDGYRIDAGDYLVNEGVLGKPFELSVNFRQEEGHPFIVTETSWKNPERYQAEGAFLTAAYQSLNGLDAVCWFSVQTPWYELDPRKPFWRVGGWQSTHKWNCAWPMQMGMFPANALIYRKGLIAEGKVVVLENRTMEDLLDRKAPVIDDNEVYGDARQQAELAPGWKPSDHGEVNRAAYLVGPVRSHLGAAASRAEVADLATWRDPGAGVIRSNTGELSWNYRKRLATMNAPAAQGVCGFLEEAGGHFALQDLTIDSSLPYATIQAVAMDGESLARSGRILLQVGTEARLSGWRTEAATFTVGKGSAAYAVEGEKIIAIGGPPWRVANAQGKIVLRNSRLTKAVLLDPNGYAIREIPLTRENSGVALDLPPDSLYLLLTP